MRRLAISIGLVALAAVAAMVWRPALADPAAPVAAITDEQKLGTLLKELGTIDLDRLPALPMPDFALPDAGVDVMRVKLSERYTVKGVGRDDVQLTGWIAVKHDNPKPAVGETGVRWGTAVSDTEFVGLELQGTSSVFGPVRVSLDRTVPSRGRVGKLETPFLAQTVLDLAYRDHRRSDLIPMGDIAAPSHTASAPAGDVSAVHAVDAVWHGGQGAPLFVLAPPPAGPTFRPTKATQKAVEAVIRGTMDAVSNKDAQAMLRNYAPDAENVFFNVAPTTDVQVRGAEKYVQGVSKMFENLSSIKVIPNDDMRVAVSGKLAVVTVTGRNEVIDKEGKRGTGPWRWTVELQQTGNKWLITHDHLSFFRDPATAGIPNAAGKCIANISVSVNMPQLDLQMRTQDPVQWYSEVTTIPPVGHTASVSLTPTPMVSGDREVATLEHGAVNFREVVRHVRLAGTRETASLK